MFERTERGTTERLFRQQSAKLTQTATLLLGNEDDAQDVVSDVFMRLLDGKLQLPQKSPESYLMVCVRNRCVDRLRHLSVRQRMKQLLTLNCAPSITPVETELEIAGEVMTYAREQLAPLTWDVFRLRFDEELSYRDISLQLHVTEATVYKHLAQALRQLRERFNPVRQ